MAQKVLCSKVPEEIHGGSCTEGEKNPDHSHTSVGKQSYNHVNYYIVIIGYHVVHVKYCYKKFHYNKNLTIAKIFPSPGPLPSFHSILHSTFLTLPSFTVSFTLYTLTPTLLQLLKAFLMGLLWNH